MFKLTQQEHPHPKPRIPNTKWPCVLEAHLIYQDSTVAVRSGITSRNKAWKWHDHLTRSDENDKCWCQMRRNEVSKWHDHLTWSDENNMCWCQMRRNEVSKWRDHLTWSDENDRCWCCMRRNEVSKWHHHLTRSDQNVIRVLVTFKLIRV